MQPSISNSTPINGIPYPLRNLRLRLSINHATWWRIDHPKQFRTIIPILANNHQIIAIESQAHGRTTDRNSPSSFSQDAEDVAQLMEHLKINKADILGFSNGSHDGSTIGHQPPRNSKQTYFRTPLAKRSGVADGFWEFMKNASLKNMPPQLKEAFLRVNPSEEGLLNMHDKDAARMLAFKDIFRSRTFQHPCTKPNYPCGAGRDPSSAWNGTQ